MISTLPFLTENFGMPFSFPKKPFTCLAIPSVLQKSGLFVSLTSTRSLSPSTNSSSPFTQSNASSSSAGENFFPQRLSRSDFEISSVGMVSPFVSWRGSAAWPAQMRWRPRPHVPWREMLTRPHSEFPYSFFDAVPCCVGKFRAADCPRDSRFLFRRKPFFCPGLHAQSVFEPFFDKHFCRLGRCVLASIGCENCNFAGHCSRKGFI